MSVLGSGSAPRVGVTLGHRLQTIGTHVTRYGLVLVLLWIGCMKFTAYEAEGIKPLVANSPFMGWVYDVMSVTAFSSLLGGWSRSPSGC